MQLHLDLQIFPLRSIFPLKVEMLCKFVNMSIMWYTVSVSKRVLLAASHDSSIRVVADLFRDARPSIFMQSTEPVSFCLCLSASLSASVSPCFQTILSLFTRYSYLSLLPLLNFA